MILKYGDSIVQHKLLIPSSVKYNWEHSSIHEWLSLRPIRQGCNQQLRQGCATYNSESFSWSPNWASCDYHGFWNHSRLIKFPKISQQNVLEWVSENCDILRRPIDGTEYLSWLFLNDMRLYCWPKCITISNAFLEIDRHLNLLLPHFLHFGITQKTGYLYRADQILLNPLRSVKNTRPVFPQVRSRDAVSVWEWSSAIELGCTATQ